MKKILTFFLSVILFYHYGLAQADPSVAFIVGTIIDGNTDDPIELVTVYVDGTTRATETDTRGKYKLKVTPDKPLTIIFTRIGYKKVEVEVPPLPAAKFKKIDVTMAPANTDIEVIVTEKRIENEGMVQEKVKELKLIPISTGNLESVLPSIALGTSSGTGGELSSQYNVRGGNYDENLVYVNDFEIYRPQLIRAGQQEGLTFPNMDLIRDLSFSSGGFQAKYGDKMSSVLDIKYKRPDSLRASVGMSFLGGSAHIEGSKGLKNSDYRRFRYLLGARYKTTKYLLGSLDVTGEYTPNFTDIQGYFTYDLNLDWQVGLMVNHNRSKYQFIPKERSTGFGLVDFALQLYSVFEGQEVDDFTTDMGGLSFTYLPDRKRNPFYLKFLLSSFQSIENERFDILGYYSLRQIESDLGSDDYGKVLGELGTGTQHQYVRNSLFSNVSSFQVKGGIELQKDSENTISHFLQWGAKYNYEIIEDRINEWERLDSAGYSLPYDTAAVRVWKVLKPEPIQLTSSRVNGYFQDTYTYEKKNAFEMKLSAGVRASWWSLNNDFNISPRAQLLYKPLKSKKDISWKLAGGLYFQPPFYRELRNTEGEVNKNAVAQKSAHAVVGFTYDFHWKKLSNRRFRFITEAYYKQLWDLISYDVDNVRIRYSGKNDATGYITGIDFRINGQFVPGAESWANLSFLRARERLNGIQHLKREIGVKEAIKVKDVPRPSDRLMMFSVFFQDYLKKHKNLKMHLNFTVGTGLPYGLRGKNTVYRNTYRYRPYHRVDIGFSALLWTDKWKKTKLKHPLRFTRKTWIKLEIFNLMNVENEASKTWIKTIFKQQYAIPNFLTSRRINLRLKMEF